MSHGQVGRLLPLPPVLATDGSDRNVVLPCLGGGVVAQGEMALGDSDALSAQSGDGEAFARLLRRHEKSLDTHLGRFTGNGADLQDLRQETYLEVFRSLRTYRHQGPFVSWLRRIASRVGYRYWSGKAKETRAKAAYLESVDGPEMTPSVLSWQEGVEGAKALLVCLGHDDRAMLEMRYIQGMTAMEIADVLGWNVNRVRVRLHRAIKRLRARPPERS